MSASHIEIRRLGTYPEFLLVQKLHQEAWGLPEGAGIYPPVLNTISKNGGVVIGAFDQDVLVGFVYGFLGREGAGLLKLCSQTMGVDREYRRIGIGTRLKWAQRDFAIQMGLPLITWTFDPLETASAYLNLNKLGAISKTYLPNLYGERFTALGTGLPSDRLLAEWWVLSPRVVSGALNHLPSPTGENIIVPSEEIRLVDIPDNFQLMRKTNPEFSAMWRYKVRAEFQAALDDGFVATGFYRTSTQLAYILEKMPH